MATTQTSDSSGAVDYSDKIEKIEELFEDHNHIDVFRSTDVTGDVTLISEENEFGMHIYSNDRKKIEARDYIINFIANVNDESIFLFLKYVGEQ
ncbi:hypothetical protein ACFQL7_20520 [Halocatena marina]|uniref:Uncharacterized protein n=1 Tax=Halocatena marina TaxID=2934937 RepID=A0ABD5YU73_9EURY|nr:hypothetical protein [Halocatena marina]